MPNLPGALIRRLSHRLGVSPTVAMRIALLYGDIEWRAGNATRLLYSASDYARRMGFHRNTVHADLQRLQELGAIAIDCDRANTCTVDLQGLLRSNDNAQPLAENSSNPCSSGQQPCTPQQQPPCPPQQQALAHDSSNPLLPAAATLEKGLKTQEKQDQKKKSGEPARSGKAQEPAEELPGNLQGPEAEDSSAQEAGAPPEPGAPDAKAEVAEPDTSAALAAPEPDGPAGTGLIDRLLAAFRESAPSEWPAPERLTVSRERRSRLRQALEHAGSAEALERRLRAALAHVPPWFRTTYPVRPDGSRRPAYQFFDLLFRASAAERECGVEAWHLFAWSEGRSGDSARQASSLAPSPADTAQLSDEQRDLQNARRWFSWGTGLWCIRDIQGFKVTAAEQRRLTGLLEARGEGIPGTGAIQFADPPPEPQPPGSQISKC